TLRSDDVARAGGKGANLGELTAAGLPVPDGFVVTADAYRSAMERAGVRDELRRAAAAVFAGEVADLAATVERLRATVRSAGIPADLAALVDSAYRDLAGDEGAVVVRSSATSEDTAAASFAGMHDSFANVIGTEAVRQRVLDCWVSLFSERALSYRAERGMGEEPTIAVVVQRLVPAVAAGVMLTDDPADPGVGKLVIEAARGLGEAVVSGLVEPDTYVVDTGTHRVATTRRGAQHVALERRAGGGVEQIDLPDRDAGPVLADHQVLELARLGEQIAAHYGCPQDVEWVIAPTAVGPDGTDGTRTRCSSCSPGPSRPPAQRQRRRTATRQARSRPMVRSSCRGSERRPARLAAASASCTRRATADCCSTARCSSRRRPVPTGCR
ncbi:MAG: PEP/pyruvate-binding domain-containing protein, partial [Microthrixaceae bacterium]